MKLYMMRHAEDGETNKLWYDSAARGDDVSGPLTTGGWKGQRWNANRQNHQNNRQTNNLTVIKAREKCSNASFQRVKTIRRFSSSAFVLFEFFFVLLLLLILIFEKYPLIHQAYLVNVDYQAGVFGGHHVFL
jgi:hypothetical protein